MSRRLTGMIIGCALMAIGLVHNSAFADLWGPPGPAKYYSLDSSHYLEVIPKDLEREYREWLEKKKNKKDIGYSKEANDNYCKGTLYELDEKNGYQQIWSLPLVNTVSPHQALVSNSGDYVITFDSWVSIGYGDDVVVIYGPNGELIRKFPLGDILSAAEIDSVHMTVSSRWWGGKHYLDEESGVLVLKVVSNCKRPRDERAAFKDVKISLKTGDFISKEQQKH